jgi:hypothetical protein
VDKIKSQKEVKKTEELRFFLLFLLDDRRIRIRGSIPMTYGSGSRRPGSGSATLQRRCINIGLPQNFHIIHFTETTVMYLCRYDKGQQDSGQFIFLLDQRKKLIALFEWPAVIVIKYTPSMWHASFLDLFTNLLHFAVH